MAQSDDAKNDAVDENVLQKEETVSSVNPEKKILFCSQCGARLTETGDSRPSCGSKAK